MPLTRSPAELTLSQVEDQFGLRQILPNTPRYPDFWAPWLPLWQPTLAQATDSLSPTDRATCDRIKTEFLYLSKYPLLEDLVKMVALSPLLSLAGFYQPPLHLAIEQKIEIATQDGDRTYTGRIDLLALKDELWIAVIESKQASFALKEAIPQVLSYMAANPHPTRPTLGLATNGSHTLFLKRDGNDYALSPEFSLYRTENELYPVLAILRAIVAGAT